MKVKLVFFLLFIIFLISCKDDDGGTINYKLKYTTSTDIFRSASTTAENTYSQFGDYITSITPYHFSSKIGMLVYQDFYSQSNPNCHMISFVDGHDNDPRYEMATYADFSGNQEVIVDPILYSTDLVGDRIFKQKEVTFNFFTFSPVYLYQEFELPIEYKSLLTSNNPNLYNFGNESSIIYDSINNKITVKVKDNPLIAPFFLPLTTYSTPQGYIFGNTDSTYIYKYDGTYLPEEQRFPFWDGGPLVRCNKFTPLTVRMPDEGQTITMYSTIGFDTNNLIQIYAGNDNIPYTNDDVFVYAPRYWERLQVKLEIR